MFDILLSEQTDHPLYMQLYMQIRNQIRNGLISIVDVCLPSDRYNSI